MKYLQPYAYKGVDIRFYFKKDLDISIIVLRNDIVYIKDQSPILARKLFDEALQDGKLREVKWDLYSEDNRLEIIRLIFNYYLNESMQSLLEAKLSSIVKQQDLKKWNKIQKELWVKTTQKLGIDRNDIDKFFKFGEFFYDFVSKYNKTPTLKQIRGLYDI